MTFVHRAPDSELDISVKLLTPCLGLFAPTPLKLVDDSLYLALTLRVPKGQRHRYRFILDGQAKLDAINPQTMVTPQGEV